MDAVEFFEEHDRMCNSFGGNCTDCEIYKVTMSSLTCNAFIFTRPREMVAIVERWAKEHPRKTRESELLERLSKMFPRMNQDNFWWREICPKDIDAKVKCPVRANGMTMHCTDCREIYWLSEVEDDDQSND